MKETKIGDIAKGTDPKTQLIFCSEQADSTKFHNVNINTSIFSEIGLKNSEFRDSSFTQCHFKNIYFRGSSFCNTRFTGTTFTNCNFKKCSFQSCDFRYCSFYRCELPADEIISCLPNEPNLRRDLARNLRVNADSLGEKRNSDVFLDIEINASEKTYVEIFFANTKYYKDSYDSLARIQSAGKYILSKLSGITWGYGHRIGKLLLSYMLIITAISLIKVLWDIEFETNGHNVHLSLFDSIILTFSESVGADTSGYIPTTTGGKVILYLEKLFSTVYLALLSATLYRKVAR